MRPWVVYTAIAMVFYFLGDCLTKLYADPGGRPWHAVAGVAAYSMTCVLWFPTMADRNEMCAVGMLWLAMYTIIGFLVAMGIFGERPTWTQIAGMVMIVAGAVVMERA